MSIDKKEEIAAIDKASKIKEMNEISEEIFRLLDQLIEYYKIKMDENQEFKENDIMNGNEQFKKILNLSVQIYNIYIINQDKSKFKSIDQSKFVELETDFQKECNEQFENISKHNPKKEAYETLVKPKEQKQLWRWIAITNAPFLLLLPFLGNSGRWGIAGFLFFSVFYSMPPIRAKVRPLIDSIFNVLYIFPGIVGYAVVSKTMPSLYLCLAAAFWCMAMHAYSAVPDIQADKKAKINTIATQLGKAGTLLFCLVCYGLAAGLSISTLGQFSIAAGMLYGFMMIITLQAKNAKAVMKLYSLFPYINMGVGMALFFWILLVVK